MNKLVEALNSIYNEIRELKNVLQDIRGGIDNIKEEVFTHQLLIYMAN